MKSSTTCINYETIALANVINKLQIYMDQNKQTLHGLASTMGFAYQPFYRLITKKHMPTISSLGLISSHLNCTIAELTDDNIFIDINYYNNIDEDFEIINDNKCRVYIPYENYAPLLNSNFFAVKYKNKKSNPTECNNIYQLFHAINHITIDGIFLVNYLSKKTLINVLSVSSKYVVIQEGTKEVKVDINLIKPIAQFFNYLELTEKQSSKLIGVKI